MYGSISSRICNMLGYWEYEVVYTPYANHKIIFRGDVLSRAEARRIVKTCKETCQALEELQCTQRSR